MRIQSVTFENFRLLRDTVLPLEPLTVIVGPNNSGKTSALDALALLAADTSAGVRNALPYGADEERTVTALTAAVAEDATGPGSVFEMRAVPAATVGRPFGGRVGGSLTVLREGLNSADQVRALRLLSSYRSVSLIPAHMRRASVVSSDAVLASDGANIAAVLDRLRDTSPERFEALNRDLGEWLPEFDRVLFDVPADGAKTVSLRTRRGGHPVPTLSLSEGTLGALGLLTVVHTGAAPAVVGIEEPERGIHPRLLRNVFDGLLRMAYPAENGSDQPPQQVVVTTHSPYLLDLFRDIPECVVIAERVGDAATFARLADHPDVDDIVMAGQLGDAWYSGVLGGVPVGPERPTIYPPTVAAA